MTDLHKFEKSVVDPHTEWQEECTSGTQVVEDEQLLFTTDLPVIPLGGFLHVFLVFRHLFRVGERDTI